MLPLGSRPLRLSVLGSDEAVTDRLSKGMSDVDMELKVQTVAPETILEETKDSLRADCLVIDGPETDIASTELVQEAIDAGYRPVVLLVPPEETAVIEEALEVGVKETIPREVLTDAPEVLAERIVRITRREFSRRGYRELYDRTEGSISIHDPETGRMLHANRTLADMLGYEYEALLSKRIGDITADVTGYDHERAMRAVKSVAESGDALELEWPLETADGEVRWVEARLETATIGNREIVFSLSSDVTERRRREREYEQIFDSVSDAIIVHDPWGEEIREVNQALCDLTGYSRDALLEMGLDGFSVTEEGFDAARAYEIQQRVMASRSAETVEWRLETAGGEYRDVEATLTPATIGGEERILVLCRDVTEQKRRERAIQALEDATERMQEMTTAEEVAETAVQAVRDALDLPLAMCWFHEAGRLDPVTATDEVHEAGLWSPLGPDRYEYDVFEKGEVTTYSPRETAPDNPLESAVLLPLGEHGLIAGGREDSATYDEVTLDIARTLAEHTTTALDRVERAREVRENERRFRLIADRIDEVIFYSEPDFSELFYVNSAYEEIWGESIENLFENPRGFVDRIDPRDREAVEADLEAMVADIQRGDPDDTYTFEYRVRPTEEEVRWVHATGYPVEVETADGESTTRFVGVIEDVTERRELERTYQGVFENVSDGLVIHDPDTGEILEVNERFCEMNGYEREELIGETVDVVTGPDHAYEKAQARIQAARNEGPQLFEWRNQRKDGETFPVEVHLSVVDIRGEERVLGSVRDITERKRREREYEQIFNGVNASIVIQDPETAEPVDANQAFLDRLGYDSVAAIREEGFNALSATSAGFTKERAQEICHRVMETGEPETVEWQQVTKDGERRWIEAKVDSAVIQGEERILSMQRDVTEQRRTERRLRAILDRIDEAIFLTRAEEITRASESPDYVSSGYEEIWGQSLEQIRETYDRGFFDTLHPDERDDYRAFMERIVTEIEAGDADDRYSLEYRIEGPDGGIRWVHSDYYPLEWEGGPPRIVIVSRDVTERKERERRIASFDEATDDLATADDPEEAANVAVEAATETLDLSAVGVFLYDEGEGVLRPEVWSEPLTNGFGDRTIAPGESPLWTAFAAGSVAEPAENDPNPGLGGSEDTSGDFRFEDWRGIGLGNHGVLFVASIDDPIDPGTLQSAYLLAATLEAALNHLRGQRRLALQEEELRTQTERAERLDRIARITQEVETAINEASGPDEVSRAVCERLADAGPYEAAWVGGVSVGADQIDPRAVVGVPRQRIEGLDLRTTTDAADPHPAVTAWRTDDVSVIDSLVDAGPTSDWRQRALAAGFQSLCAVPLTHDGITHGVLTVAADAPNAFGDRERDVLVQLGTSIGYAFAAIERRRTLESDETVELEFEGEKPDIPFAQAASEAGCTVRHERTVPREHGEVSVYFRFEGAVPDDAAEIASRTFPGVVDVVSEDAGHLVVETVSDSWFGSPLAEYGAVLREASATPDAAALVVEVSAGADIRSLTDRLQRLAPSLELVAKRQHQRTDRTPEELQDEIERILTERQYEALQTALSAGYFEWPRESDGKEVAERLGITQPTLNKHLRLAENQTFTFLFGQDPGE